MNTYTSFCYYTTNFHPITPSDRHLNYFYNRFLTKSIDSIGEGSIPEIVARYIDE